MIIVNVESIIVNTADLAQGHGMRESQMALNNG
jgi:hypothetical protein